MHGPTLPEQFPIIAELVSTHAFFILTLIVIFPISTIKHEKGPCWASYFYLYFMHTYIRKKWLIPIASVCLKLDEYTNKKACDGCDWNQTTLTPIPTDLINNMIHFCSEICPEDLNQHIKQSWNTCSGYLHGMRVIKALSKAALQTTSSLIYECSLKILSQISKKKLSGAKKSSWDNADKRWWDKITCK